MSMTMAMSAMNVARALLPLPAQFVSSSREDEEARRELREELLLSAKGHARTLLRWTLRASQVAVVLTVLVLTATALYAALYWLVMPSRLHEQEIHFDYGTHAALTGVQTVRDSQVFVSLPTAHMQLVDTTHQWQVSPEIAGEQTERVPQSARQKGDTQSHVLVAGMTYDVFVELQVPESDVNRAIGMFMLNTTLRSADGLQLASSARPLLVRDAHPLVEWARIALWLVPYALRVSEPTQSFLVTAINGYTESRSHALTEVVVALNHPELQVYTAKLTILAQLSGVRYLMYHWALPTAVLVILNFVFLEAIALLVLYAVYNLPSPEDDEDHRRAEPGATTGGDHVYSGGLPRKTLSDDESAPQRDIGGSRRGEAITAAAGDGDEKDRVSDPQFDAELIKTEPVAHVVTADAFEGEADVKTE